MKKIIGLIPAVLLLSGLAIALNLSGGIVEYIGSYDDFESSSASLNRNDMFMMSATTSDGTNLKIKLKLLEKCEDGCVYDYPDRIVYLKGGKGTFTVDKYSSDVWYDEITITVWKDTGLADIEGIAEVDWFREPFRNPDADFKILGLN